MKGWYDDMMDNVVRENCTNYDDTLDIRDVVYGVVIGNCSKGVFLELENGQKAFSYFCGLPCGSKVLCSVIKRATANWRVLVSIDSVISETVWVA